MEEEAESRDNNNLRSVKLTRKPQTLTKFQKTNPASYLFISQTRSKLKESNPENPN